MARTQRATASKGRATRGATRTRLLREVEALWCALGSALALYQTRAASRRGLTHTDLQAIDVLAREGTVCASDLAEECGLTPGAITGMLNRLERAGVAQRSRDRADARRLVIRPVEARPGAECLMPHALGRVVDSFTDADLRSIRRFLQASAEALRHEADAIDSDDRAARNKP